MADEPCLGFESLLFDLPVSPRGEIRAKDLSVIDTTRYEELRKGYEEVSGILNGLIGSLKKDG